jgi:hypothetical protein
MIRFLKYPFTGLLLLMLVFTAKAQDKEGKRQNKVEWHAYTQLRFATNFDNYNNFSVRRLKFWIRSAPGFSKHWSFKAQAIFTSVQREKFFLQDIYGQYTWKNSSIRFGQFIPKYSLQWSQPDYLIPATERARAINLLIPDGTMGIRDIGIQYNLTAFQKKLHFNIGIFNGYGIKDYRYNNSGVMITQNLSYKIPFKKTSLQFGYSVMYRNGEDLFLPGIITDTLLYTGREFSFNVNAIFISRIVDIQAEYLQANPDTVSASGYYALAKVKFNAKNHAYLMYDHYTYGYETQRNSPWYIAGFNYLFKHYDIMLTLETGFQKSAGEWVNRTVLQFQMFFH